MSRLIFTGATNKRRRMRVVPYHKGSQACSLFSREMKCLRVSTDPEQSKFIARMDDTLVNWGYSGTLPEHLLGAGCWINHPTNVRVASNKLTCFEALRRSGIPIPDFTVSRGLAECWLNGEALEDDEEGKPCDVVCRHTLNGHSGEGIEIVDKVNTIIDKNINPTEEDFKVLPNAPLYVKYIPKRHEYRAHVLPGGATIIRQKLRNPEVPSENVDWRVRSHGNGFIFAQELTFKPEGIETIAEEAVDSLNLEFGAVDIIYNEKRNQVYVLEVNTAPGLEGSTLDLYSGAFKKYLGLDN